MSNQRWEYLWASPSDGDDLGELGQAGWEAVGLSHHISSDINGDIRSEVTVLMKRLLPDSEDDPS